MFKKKLLSFLILFIFAVLIGCTSDKEETKGKEEPETKEEQKEDSEDTVEVKDDEEDEEIEDAQASADEEQIIDGKVIVKEDENVIRVEAETNLIEGTFVNVNVFKAFGELSSPIGEIGSEKEEIKSDGTVSIDYPLDEDFFEKYHGEYIEVQIEVRVMSFPENVVETYGEHGKKFKGPFVYQFDLIEPEQRLYVPIYIKVGDERTEYTIETPEREPLPDDYGETDVWLEAEVVDNDHRFLYVEGKSNLLEGMMLQGRYYSDEEATFPQVLHNTKMFIEPDGTFLLPVKYDSITNDGYIEVQGAPVRSHRTKEQIYEVYGENFENLTGEVVKEVDDHQEILLTIESEGIDMDAPEDSLVTEDDGELKIQVPDDVLFDFDKSDLKADEKTTLDEVIDILEALDDGEDVQINGHTDNEGDADYNLKLSEERAASVEAYLSKNGDLNHLNIEIKGYGETQPIESNEEEEGRAKNRRVEIVFNKE